ncbi:MAG: OmpH family outer membrane protein [Pirellulaceae bacterium]|nr:OmpH family outer membrane protein [Pirellulaceae bacterium]
MRFSLRTAALAACLVSLSTAAFGQAPAAAPPPTNIVVIDVAHIFKNHNRFNGMMADIKKDIEQFDAFVRAEQQKGLAKRDQLMTYKPGSLEYKQLEEELARMQSDMQVQVSLKRKEFLEQEARVYFRVYREIEQTVAVFAQRNRISLVLRFNGDEMKEDDRASVLQGVNRAVVYQQGLDITDHILKQCNINTPAPAPGPTPPPVGPRPPIVPTGPGGATGPISPRPAVPGVQSR